MTVYRGQRVVSRTTYQARGYLLKSDEVLPEDPQDFQVASHPPRLVQITKGVPLPAAMIGRDGRLFVRVDVDGNSYACMLHSDSFDLT